MSGFVAAFGNPNRDVMKSMFEKILHRGPLFAGVWQDGKFALAQNYLGADLAEGEGHPIPFAKSEAAGPRIGYDGQMGDWEELSTCLAEPAGPFREERVLLKLYADHGPTLFSFLSDTLFAFVVSDGEKLLAARDLLGIKTLFYGRQGDTLYFASELKALAEATDDLNEFPPGHYMDESGTLHRFGDLPHPAPGPVHHDAEAAAETVRDIIFRSVNSRIRWERPTAGLLSGGMDSSVICSLASRLYRKRFGEDQRFRTFAIGVGESDDIHSARVMAAHIGTDHTELLVDLDKVLEVLPDVIYHLESFDPSLVRSSVANYLISRHAREQGVEILLSGEGGDEIFCGYTYLKEVAPGKLTEEQISCLGYLHNNASLRLDRMNQCNSIRVVAPLISGELLQYALELAPGLKVGEHDGKPMEKWIFRKAYEPDLPQSVAWRGKQEFSQGSGSAAVLPAHFETVVSDAEFEKAKTDFPILRSKEEAYYFKLFTERFGAEKAVRTVGQWISL